MAGSRAEWLALTSEASGGLGDTRTPKVERPEGRGA